MIRKERSETSIERGWLWLLISLLLTIGLLLSGSTVGVADPLPTPAPGEPAQWRITTVGTLIDAQAAEGPSTNNPKLESSLNQLVAAHRREGLADAQAFATAHMTVLEDDLVQVVIVTTQGAISDMKEAIEALGGEYQSHYEALLQALVPIHSLEPLSRRPDVQVVREPRRPIPLAPLQVGSQTTEGVGPSNASVWHAAGYDGTGVRVAVIDAGFTGYSGLLGTDLPASVTTYDWTGTGMEGSEHGTACAEVVYDMASGSTIDLHKVGTEVELGNAVSQTIADGVDIISMSLGWTLNGPGDGTGSLANIVNNARSSGIFYASAAGNEALVSWSGPFNDDGSDNHLWASSQNINYFGPGDGDAYVVPASYPIVCGLHWDDWTDVTQDYDLRLYRWTGSAWSLVTGSYNRQSGSYPTPEEHIGIYAPSSAPYGVVVSRYSGTGDACLRLVCSKMTHLDQWVSERSLTFPADSPAAITVGAVDVSSPYPLESYSSQGLTFGSGGTCSGGSTKPDIAAYANVSTVSYGAGVFNGTSAATPHVAGAAALVKQRYPGNSVAQMQSFLESGAIDLGTPGKDNLYGAGRLYLPSENLPPNTPGNPSPPDGATGVSTTTDLSWTGGDPDSGDTVTYDVYLGTSDPPMTLLCNDVSSITCDPGTLSYDTHYYWRVDATDNHGASTSGPAWDFTTGSQANNPPYAPSSPSPTDGATGVSTTADLSWTGGDPDSGDTVTYDVYLGTSDPPMTLPCNDVSSITCDPGTLSYDTHYYWRVDATDNHGASTSGPAWDFTTGSQANNPPYAPSSPSPTDGATGVSTTADLSWTGGDPDLGDTVTYDVYLGTSDPPTTLLCNDVSSITCDPGTLSYDTHYYWRVDATDNHGASTSGVDWDFTTGTVAYLPAVLREHPPRPERAYPGLDASIVSAVPNGNAGSSYDMWVGYDHCDSLGVARSLVEFDLSDMPPGITVSNATLYLYLQASCDLGNRPHTVRVYRITQDWSSSSVTWNNQPKHDSGTVWASRSVSSQSWGWYTWDVTALVNGWLSGAYPNHGIMLRGPESSGNDSAVLKFFTCDASGTTYDPRIEFSYAGSAGTGEIRGGESAWPVGGTPGILDLLGKPAAGSEHEPFELQAEEMSLLE